MLVKSGKSSALKGDRGMKEKYSMFRFVLASMAFCLLIVALITGCGGGNNPSGPDTSTAGTTGGSVQDPTTVTTGSVTGKVTNPSGIGTVGDISVNLYQNETLISTKKTLSTGDYYFEKLQAGIYIIRVEKTDNYSETATFVTISSGENVVAPELQIVSTVQLADVPTTYIVGTFTAALDNTGLSAVQIVMDSGYRTVTDVHGRFTLPNVAVGLRKLSLIKAGTVASYSLSFTVNSTDNKVVSTISYNGQEYPAIKDAGTGKYTTSLGTIAITYDTLPSGMITGTVTKYKRNLDGTLSSEKVGVPGFAFEIWRGSSAVGDPYTFSQTIVTEPDGTYKYEFIPSTTSKFQAVASGSYRLSIYDVDAKLVEYSLKNNNSPWAVPVAGGGFAETGNSIFYTTNFAVENNKTTFMDFILPTFRDW